MIYLAAPYSGMEDLSFEISCMITAFLMKEGEAVYSPIVCGHTLAAECDLPADCHFWLKQDLDILGHCDELYVVALEGWDKSVGVSAEIGKALVTGIPVTFIDPGPFVRERDERNGVG